MATTVDITNRALNMLGVRKRIVNVNQDSNEAQTMLLCFTPVVNWCFGLANWNFARGTSVLTQTKGPVPSTPGTWSSIYPSPPWLYEFALPTDFIRAIYITNSAAAASGPGYAGEPQRFVIGSDAGVAVALTNQPSAVLIYTASIADPTAWPWYFERLAVIALAQAGCMAITNNMALLEELTQMLEQQINISSQINQIEGLSIPDNTPEWVQALGINYPYRRIDGQRPDAPPTTSARRQRGGDQ